MDIYTKKPSDPKVWSRTFPSLEAQLSDDIVKELRLGPALRRFAKKLTKQYSKAGPRPDGFKQIIGVAVNNIGFQFILDPGAGGK